MASLHKQVESGPVTNSPWGNKIRNAKINVANNTIAAAGGHRDTKDFKSTETEAASAALPGHTNKELHFLAH